ncbi:MAG: hypothetical protein IKP00_14760 [Victivallales bacterium]|nr:hypothetical protein [Victivallales bacterium]
MVLRWTCLVLLLAWMVTAQELSVSLQLESQMVLRRGFEVVASLQQEDGSWNGECGLTARCLLALAATGVEGDYAPFKQNYEAALAFLRHHAAECPPKDVPLLVCALIRAGGGVQGEAIALLGTLGEVSEDGDALCAMEALCLCGAYKTGEGNLVLRRLMKRQKRPAYKAAAAALCSGDVSPLNLRRDCADEEELYWATRVLMLHPEAFGGNWRNTVVSILLDHLKSDGIWGDSAQTDAERLCATAFALQTIILCTP